MSGALDPYASACALRDALAARTISARELLALYRARIERHNPVLNVVVQTDFARAEQHATEADQRLGRGIALPLPTTPGTWIVPPPRLASSQRRV